MTQSTIFNICKDIVQLVLLLGSVDPETHVLCELYNIDVVLHSVLQWVICRQDLRVSPSRAWLGERIMTSDSQLDPILSLRSTG